VSVAEPRDAWLVTNDGERVECLLKLVSPGHWHAIPIRPLRRDEVSEGSVDVLPPHTTVAFVFEDMIERH
jgi:hypothetical protein